MATLALAAPPAEAGQSTPVPVPVEPASYTQRPKVKIGDITSVAGVRDNYVMGYGLVVGLAGTGDGQQDLFPVQTLTNILQKMGVQAPAKSVITRNVAAVFVTAELPPFADPGTRIDVNVSSTGDARSLQGGELLMTPLYGPDGQIYAVAQGSVVLGGYTAGAAGNVVTVNHPTAGRIPNGGVVERGVSLDLSQLKDLSLLLHDADFLTAENVAGAINQTFGERMAVAMDSRRIQIQIPSGGAGAIPRLLARLEAIPVVVHRPAKVVLDERTGTVVMGGNVNLGACSIFHGNLAIQISTEYQVSQPAPFSNTGNTVVVPQTTVHTQESNARQIQLHQGATVQDLVNGLQGIGSTARDIIAIVQAMKADGCLQSSLDVI
ncbi:MAG: flagellar basal body P-ring protein FlgI [Acidobacteriota bacterium]|nr:flagellar basal body P-ring protein FlgI [Acidobacteriota bacterium]